MSTSTNRRRCKNDHLVCVGCGHCRCKGTKYVFRHVNEQHTLCGPCRYGSMLSDSIYSESGD